MTRSESMNRFTKRIGTRLRYCIISNISSLKKTADRIYRRILRESKSVTGQAQCISCFGVQGRFESRGVSIRLQIEYAYFGNRAAKVLKNRGKVSPKCGERALATDRYRVFCDNTIVDLSRLEHETQSHEGHVAFSLFRFIQSWLFSFLLFSYLTCFLCRIFFMYLEQSYILIINHIER